MKTQYVFLKKIIFLFSLAALFTACEGLDSKMDEQLNNINKRAVQLDAAVQEGLDKVEDLDSTITSKTEKIKDLDSIVRKTSTRIDSLVSDKTAGVQQLLN